MLEDELRLLFKHRDFLTGLLAKGRNGHALERLLSRATSEEISATVCLLSLVLRKVIGAPSKIVRAFSRLDNRDFLTRRLVHQRGYRSLLARSQSAPEEVRRILTKVKRALWLALQTFGASHVTRHGVQGGT